MVRRIAPVGRIDEVAAGDVLLEDVVLGGAAQLLGRHSLLLADELVEQEQHRGGRVDGHRRRDLVEGDPVERGAHVVDRVDRHPGPSHLAQAARIVGVEAELSREIEGHRQAGRAVGEQVAVALVRLPGARVAGVLAHRPQLPPVHVGVDAAGVGVIPGLAEASRQVLGQVLLGVLPVDLDPGVGEPTRIVGTDDRGDRAVLVGVAMARGYPGAEPTMQVRIRLFAGLRERAGASEVELELPDDAVVGDALEQMRALTDGVPVVMAVNREYADPAAPLHGGDEVALIPPVSGGSVGTTAHSSDQRAAGPRSARRVGARSPGGRRGHVHRRHPGGAGARIRGLRGNGRAPDGRDRSPGRAAARPVRRGGRAPGGNGAPV